MTACRRSGRHEICYLYSILFIEVIIKKSHPPTVDSYGYQCGFLHHIARLIKAHKQTNQSVYVLFSFRNYLFKRLLTIYATNPSPLSGLSVKGDRDTSSLPFTTRKGVRSYEAIYFPNHNRKSI